MKKKSIPNRKKQTKKYRKQRKTKKSCGCLKLDIFKGGKELKSKKMKGGEYGQIPNYALNTWNSDPNDMQMSARNLQMHHTGGSLLASFSAIDGQEAANTILAKSPMVNSAPNVQPLHK